MESSSPYRLPEVRITLHGGNQEPLEALRQLVFLFYAARVYEQSQLTDERQWNGVGWRSNLVPERRLILETVEQHSPWLVSFNVADVMTCLGAIWVLIQAIEKASTIRLNRQKLRAEITKLYAETEKLRHEAVHMGREHADRSSNFVNADRAVSHMIHAEEDNIRSNEADINMCIETMASMEISIVDISLTLREDNFRQNNAPR